jgi:hypothetical protein
MLQEQRALVAEIDLSRGDFGAKDPREVRLQPACRVTCDVSSLGLREVNRPIERTLVLLSQPGRSRMYSVQCFATGTHTEFLLPSSIFLRPRSRAYTASPRQSYRRSKPGRTAARSRSDSFAERS